MKIDKKLKDQILSQPIFFGKIVSGSMIPVINVGEEIKVEVKARNLKKFDIVVFIDNDVLVCHYIWNINQFIEPKLMQTRNIAGGKDYPITEENYIGKVLSHHLSFLRKLKIIFFQ